MRERKGERETENGVIERQPEEEQDERGRDRKEDIAPACAMEHTRKEIKESVCECVRWCLWEVGVKSVCDRESSREREEERVDGR